jgi:Uma2 family endonuclease
MTGATESHNLIVTNIVASLHAQVRRRPCRVYPGDMRVKVSRVGLYTYPAVSVVCEPPQYEDVHRDTLLNPVLAIEVLSPSTESYDRGKKFQFYRTLSSLREYVLVAQDTQRIERYVRQDDGMWLLDDAHEPDAMMSLESIDCTLTLADVYEKVEFEGE